MSDSKNRKTRKKGEPQDLNIKKFDGDVLDYIEKSGISKSKFMLMACQEKIERDSK